MLKSYGWWGGVGWVAYVILVSAQVPLVLTLRLWTLELKRHHLTTFSSLPASHRGGSWNGKLTGSCPDGGVSSRVGQSGCLRVHSIHGIDQGSGARVVLLVDLKMRMAQ